MLSAVAVGAAVFVANALAGVPATQTCNDSPAALTFTLPADWACEAAWQKPAPGAQYGGVAPGNVVELAVYRSKVSTSEAISAYVTKLVAVTKLLYANAGSGLKVTAANTAVGIGQPAVRVEARYHGVWLQGAGAVGQIVHVSYFFLQAGDLFEFDYSGVTPWVAKDLSTFAASARSIRFKNAA